MATSVAASRISATRRVEVPPSSSLAAEAARPVAVSAVPGSAALDCGVCGATGAAAPPDVSPQIAAILGDWGLGVEVGAGSGVAVPAGVSVEPFPALVPPPFAGPPAPPAAPPAALPEAGGTPAGAHGAAARVFDWVVEESALPLGCAYAPDSPLFDVSVAPGTLASRDSSAGWLPASRDAPPPPPIVRSPTRTTANAAATAAPARRIPAPSAGVGRAAAIAMRASVPDVIANDRGA